MENLDELLRVEDPLLKKIEVEGLKNINDILKKLYHIWIEFGLDEKQKEQRAYNLWSHANLLFKDILSEENELYEDLKERIHNYKLKIEELSSILNITVDGNAKYGNICKTEESLRKQLDDLNKLKHRRVKQYQEMKTEEVHLCKMLGIPELQLSSNTGVPSEKDIRELGEQKNLLIKEKDKRRQRLHVVKKELTTILETTESTPETLIEKEILLGKEENMSLTGDTFKALEEAISKHQKRKEEMELEKKHLMEKLEVLWCRLKIDDSWKKDFLSKHTDYKLSTLKAIQQELQRCKTIKQENTKTYIEALRKELVALWDKCLVSESERDLFAPFFANQMTESVLEAHEVEADKWRTYQGEVDGIIKKIEERTKLWDRMNDFEKRVANPDRLKNNRGGRLLKEEKERKKFQKDLPTLENVIFQEIRQYEEESGKSFQYFGEDYQSYVTRQWDERMSQKENIKLERQKQHKRLLEAESMLGTPAKRMLQISATPKSAPSKLFKSSAVISVARTPKFMKPKAIPSSVGKLAVANSSKRLFSPLTSARANQMKNKEALRLASTMKGNATTYDQFASLLNKTSKRNLRSSVLSCRKSGGTRTSASGNRSKKKFTKSASRKSTRLSSTSSACSILTPARGKLGLPFLI